MPENAIVRRPSSSFCDCISEHPRREQISQELAVSQHIAYCETLRDLGLKVTELPSLQSHPDSCFVEDTAIIHGDRAIITRMARESRRGEEKAIENILQNSFDVSHIESPGTIEGGDVIHFEDYLIVGKTERTNQSGIDQMAKWLDTRVIVIDSPNIVHLKSYVTALSEDTILTTEKFAHHSAFEAYEKIIIPHEEAYAANTLTIGDTVLMPNGFPMTMGLIHDRGFSVVVLETTEFEKCEGALTCLSIIY